MPHTWLACNGGSGGVVHRVDSTLGNGGRGDCEGHEGGEYPHGRRRGSLKENVISVGQPPLRQPPPKTLAA
jgi:hypothetical protein